RDGAHVVRVEDALLAGEDGDVDDRPGAEEHEARAAQVGPRRAARQPQPGDEGDRGERQQPADLGADLLVEHPPQARRAAEAAAAEPAATTDPAPTRPV